jgi:uracil-DNA glycosylase
MVRRIMKAHSLVKHSGDAQFADLLESVKRCQVCAEFLPLGPRPVVQLGPQATILIAGQAPGRRVHESGVPFDDPSGDRLREWLGISKEFFYDPTKVAILPMGFCYPGTGKSGDLPPRPECEKTWRQQLLSQLTGIKLTLVIGQYAQKWHLAHVEKNLTETVRAWKEYGPRVIPLPHPSPRNNIWLKKNPWFSKSLLPELKMATRKALEI